MTLDTRWKFPQGKNPEHLYDCLFNLIRELRRGATDDAEGVTAAEVSFAPAGNIAATTVQLAIQELDGEKQASDADLAAIAGLSPANDDVIQRKAGAWTNRTMAQLIADLAALGTTFQPLDTDLAAIAALSTTSFGRSLLTLANVDALLALTGLRDTNLTITVGTGGDYATLNAALAAAAKVHPAYVSGGITIAINILTGYTETAGVSVVGLDLRYITITAVDDPVPATVSGDLFYGENGWLPQINARFDMGSSGGHGISLLQAGVSVGENAGVINAGKSALWCLAGCYVTAFEADFHDAQEFGGYINHASVLQADAANFSGAGQAGGVAAETGEAYSCIHSRHSSIVNLGGATNARKGVSDSADDIVVRFGGIIDVNDDVVGGKSQPPNLVSGHGVIFHPEAPSTAVIASGSFPAAATLAVAIPEWVKRLSIQAVGASSNTASRYPIVLASMDGGSTYETAFTSGFDGGGSPVDDDGLISMFTAVAAARSWSFDAIIDGVGGGGLAAEFSGITDDFSAGTLHGRCTALGAAYDTRVTHIRFGWNATAIFDAGTYRVVGSA